MQTGDTALFILHWVWHTQTCSQCIWSLCMVCGDPQGHRQMLHHADPRGHVDVESIISAIVFHQKNFWWGEMMHSMFNILHVGNSFLVARYLISHQ